MRSFRNSMREKIRVLYLIDSLEPGGAEQSLVEMLPGLLSEGIAISVALLRCTDTPLKRRAESLGVPIYCINATNWRAVSRIRNLIKTHQPDVLHTTLFLSDLWGRLASLGLPVVRVVSLVTAYGSPYARKMLPGSRWKRWLLNRADWILSRFFTDVFHAITDAVREDAQERYDIPRERVRVVYRGRSRARLGYPSQDRKMSLRESFGFKPDDVIVVMLARQVTPKGYPVLLRAVAALRQKGVKFIVLCAGKEGNETPKIQALVHELELQNTVHALGHRDDAGDLLAIADIFVLPSLWEGLGSSLIEAMAMALPIVASDLPAVREIVDEKGGILFPPGDADALARALQQLIENPDLRIRMGKHNLEKFEAQFTIDRTAKEMAEFYRWAMQFSRKKGALQKT